MFRWISNLFTVRKAVFKWESNLGKGTVKVLFSGSFSQAESRQYALQQIVPHLKENEVLWSISFVGIEG
jgi:hypothetical protein